MEGQPDSRLNSKPASTRGGADKNITYKEQTILPSIENLKKLTIEKQTSSLGTKEIISQALSMYKANPHLSIKDGSAPSKIVS